MENNFPQVLWRVIFHKFYEKQDSTNSMKTRFHKFYGKQFSTNSEENNVPQILCKNIFSTKCIENQFSTNSGESNCPQILWKTRFQCSVDEFIEGTFSMIPVKK